MALIAMAVGAFIVFIAFIAVLTAWGDRREIKGKQGKPFCGCGHHRAMHDPGTNECHESVYEGAAVAKVRCACRQYVGPEPLPTYYAPEIEK